MLDPSIKHYLQKIKNLFIPLLTRHGVVAVEKVEFTESLWEKRRKGILTSTRTHPQLISQA